MTSSAFQQHESDRDDRGRGDNPAAPQDVRTRWVAALALIVLLAAAGAGFLLLSARQPVISDTLGYIHAGQRLAAGHGLTFYDELNLTAGPYFFLHAYRLVHGPSAAAFFGYPPGYPLLVALGVLATGAPAAAFYVTAILAVVGVWLTARLGLLFTGNQWSALWGALVLAVAVDYWEFATAPWSEVPSLVCITGGVVLFLMAQQRERRRPRLLLLAAAGCLIGFSFFIRYTNALLVLPGLVLYDVATQRQRIFRSAAAWVLYGVIGVWCVGLLVYNTVYFDGPFNSIYSTTELGAYPWPMFSLAYVAGASPFGGHNLPAMAATLWRNFGLALLLAPVGWFWMRRPAVLINLAIVAATLGLYAIYAFPPIGLNARFLLPLLPFVATAIGHGAVRVGQALPSRTWRWAGAALLLVLLLWPLPAAVGQIQERNRAADATVAQVKALVAQTPANAVFLSQAQNDLIAYYGGRAVLNYRRSARASRATGEFDLATYERCTQQTVDRVLAQGIPVYFVHEEAWGIADLLAANYRLSPVATDAGLYQVTPRGQRAATGPALDCR